MAISGYLGGLHDDELVALLRRRPDLATPSPVTLPSLAARATSRTSLERALAGADAALLQMVEAVVALAEDAPPSRARVLAAVAGPDPAPSDGILVARALDDAVALALVWPEADGLHPAPGLADLVGPFPAGLAPAGNAVGGAVTVPDDLPPDERAVLDALTWGPPVGLVPPPGNPGAAAVARLLDAGLLARGGPRQVVLPRAVALALRGGRTHREPARPPAPEPPARSPATVDAESAGAGERTVRLVGRLVEEWGAASPAVLRAGGLGVRDLRALARTLEVDEPEAAFVVELAGAAGLVADDEEERPSFAPTDDADPWLHADLPARWARLAAAWLATPRAPWLVGAREEQGAHGSAHAALEPDLHRRWVPRLRATVLGVLAATPEGAAPALDDVLAALRWRAPRTPPPAGAVAALLAEAARLGVTGAGALAPAGRALLASEATVTEAAAAEAFARSLPAPVDEVLLQGDLTGIVPGRPGRRLAALLDRLARVESRGGALTVRFTPESVRAALDAGATADELLRDLAAVAPATGVPQPLEYLVRDAARRHGTLRAGVAAAYLRADDPALLVGLPDDPRLAALGLRSLAPTVLVAAVPPGELVAALRARGLAPVVEGPDGLVVHAPGAARRTRSRPRTRHADAPPDEAARLAAVVARLRSAEAEAPPRAAPEPPTGNLVAHPGPEPRRTSRPPAGNATSGSGGGGEVRSGGGREVRSAGGAPTGGTADPAAALLLLREAAADHALVWVEVVGGRGVLERRLLRPVSVEAGRLRAVDPARQAELVVAVHRIAAAEPAS